MRAAALALLALVLVGPTRAGAVGPLRLSLDDGAQADWDVCPLWGELRLRVVYDSGGLAAAVDGLAHPALRSARIEPRDDGSAVVVLTLADGIVGAQVATIDGGLELRFRDDSADGETALTERVAELLGDPPPVAREELGYLPLGAASPWSLAEPPLAPTFDGPFLPVSDPSVGDGGPTRYPVTAALMDGIEARQTALEGGSDGWWELAAARFQLAAAMQGDDATHESALALAGEAFYLAGANDEALDYFERLSFAFPRSPRAGWARAGRGIALQAMGRHDAALPQLERAGAALPSEQRGVALAALVATLASLDRPREAFAFAEALERGWPDAPLDPWLAAELAYRAGHADEAARRLDPLVSRDDPRTALAALRLADCAMLVGDGDAMRHWLERLRSEARGGDVLLARLRQLEWDLITEQVDGDFPSLITELRTLAAVHPRAALEVALAEVAYLERHAMLRDACVLDRETLRRHGSFPARPLVAQRLCGNAATLIEMAHADGDALGAAGLYLEFVEPLDAPACVDHALLWTVAEDLQQLGLPEETRRVLTTMLSSERLEAGARDDVLLRLGRLYLTMERPTEGLDTVGYYRRTATSSRLAREADLLEGELLLASGRTAEAAATLERLLARRLPAALEVAACRAAARAALREGRFADAAAQLGRARSRAPAALDGVDALFEGWARYRAGQLREAEAVLAAADTDGATPSLVEAVAYLHAATLRDLGRADEAAARLGDPALTAGAGVWPAMAADDRAALDWQRRVERLLRVPGTAHADDAAADQPSDL